MYLFYINTNINNVYFFTLQIMKMFFYKFTTNKDYNILLLYNYYFCIASNEKEVCFFGINTYILKNIFALQVMRIV